MRSNESRVGGDAGELVLLLHSFLELSSSIVNRNDDDVGLEMLYLKLSSVKTNNTVNLFVSGLV